MSFIRQHKGAVVWSVMLHVAVVAAVIVGVPWRMERPPVPIAAAAPIEGVIIDQAAIERERDKREEAARQERARVQREERQRQQAQEQQRVAERREQERVAAEQQRVTDERRARERAEQQERERVATERAEQQRREEQAKTEREAQARREREDADRRAREQAEQRRRQQAEAELQAQAAAEAEANARAFDQYLLAIEEDVRRSWNRPLSAGAGLVCVVDVMQAPTGDVLSAKVDVRRCNGDEAVRRSVEDAVRDASPLPRPPTPAVFSRTFTLTFAPDQ
jgi:colicin import membrane protein